MEMNRVGNKFNVNPSQREARVLYHKTHLKIRREELKRHCKWAKGHLFHQEDIHIDCGITAYQSCKT
ncbi:mCG1037638, isoform CRA_a [Mus musculus]|nr:mCG1037638, isoform CRA_a [Mus musculus]EDL36179.1 mCG1037638, isoform CRA_a [Mus musculus]